MTFFVSYIFKSAELVFFMLDLYGWMSLSSTEVLIDLWKEEVQKLSAAGVAMEKILCQSLITPSCGMGSLSAEAALKVLQLLDEVSRRLRKEFTLS